MDKSNNINERIGYIDVARGIAMICIILGHLGSNTINRVVFTFHVPIFYFITGYFLSDKDPLHTFIRKRARSLLIPYAAACLMIMLSASVMTCLAGHKEQISTVLMRWISASVYGAGDSYSSPFVIYQIGAIWFLWATFWGSLIVRVSLDMKPGNRIIFLLVVFMAGLWSRELFWFPFSIQAGCCAALFIYFGNLLRQVRQKNCVSGETGRAADRYPALFLNLPLEIRTVWTLFAAGVWISFIGDFQSFWLVHCDLGRGIIDVFGSVCACYCLIMLSRYMEIHIPKLAGGLAYLGRCSILILCIHIIELNTFPWKSLIDFLFSHGWPLQEKLLWTIIFKLIFDLSLAVCMSRFRFVQVLFSLKSAGVHDNAVWEGRR